MKRMIFWKEEPIVFCTRQTEEELRSKLKKDFDRKWYEFADIKGEWKEDKTFMIRKRSGSSFAYGRLFSQNGLTLVEIKPVRPIAYLTPLVFSPFVGYIAWVAGRSIWFVLFFILVWCCLSVLSSTLFKRISRRTLLAAFANTYKLTLLTDSKK